MASLEGFIGKFLGEHPEVLLSLLIPPAHFVWNRYNIHNRKGSLRQRIAELIAQRESLAKVAGLTHGDSILQDLENDLKAAMAELAPISASAEPRRKLSLRPALARWFLLYKPSGVVAWTLHSLFFLNIAIVLLGVLGSVRPWDGDAMLGLAMFLIPAYFLQWMAHRFERAGSARPTAT